MRFPPWMTALLLLALVPLPLSLGLLFRGEVELTLRLNSLFAFLLEFFFFFFVVFQKLFPPRLKRPCLLFFSGRPLLLCLSSMSAMAFPSLFWSSAEDFLCAVEQVIGLADVDPSLEIIK